MEDVSSLSISALKALIQKGGLSFEDCIDKDDLRARAKEAQDRLASAPPPTTTSSSATTGQRADRVLAGYPCIIKGPPELLDGSGGPPADLVLVCLHGLGASNTDFADILPLLASNEPALGTARIVQVYPQAPQTPIGTAWWTFDVMKFMQAAMQQDQALMAQLIRDKPEGLDACRTSMSQLLDEARKLGGGGAPIGLSKVLMAGFSLGAITALDTALNCPAGDSVAGVLFMNGAPIVVDEWAARLKGHQGLRVLQTGGQMDMTLPLTASHWVKDLLDKNGAKAELKVHMGGHEIGPADVVKTIAAFVRSML